MKDGPQQDEDLKREFLMQTKQTTNQDRASQFLSPKEMQIISRILSETELNETEKYIHEKLNRIIQRRVTFQDERLKRSDEVDNLWNSLVNSFKKHEDSIRRLQFATSLWPKQIKLLSNLIFEVSNERNG